ncbi:hypothetical protein TIFTF001_043680 [Ficus carica]|uniref:Uncharacterized protein n=1 Tax=Ficus carica TaxID=3494 RepID=A0AA87YUM9_FICCA|nr:hypothetical protein TIFTF001_043680 [Ficus carica]
MFSTLHLNNFHGRSPMIGIADQVQDLQPREMKNAPSSAASPSFIEQIEFTPLG